MGEVIDEGEHETIWSYTDDDTELEEDLDEPFYCDPFDVDFPDDISASESKYSDCIEGTLAPADFMIALARELGIDDEVEIKPACADCADCGEHHPEEYAKVDTAPEAEQAVASVEQIATEAPCEGEECVIEKPAENIATCHVCPTCGKEVCECKDGECKCEDKDLKESLGIYYVMGYIYNNPEPCYLTKEGANLENRMDGNNRYSEDKNDAMVFTTKEEADAWVEKYLADHEELEDSVFVQEANLDESVNLNKEFHDINKKNASENDSENLTINEAAEENVDLDTVLSDVIDICDELLDEELTESKDLA